MFANDCLGLFLLLIIWAPNRTLERLNAHGDHIDGKNLDIVLLNKSYEKLHQFEDKLTNLADKFTVRPLHFHFLLL